MSEPTWKLIRDHADHGEIIMGYNGYGLKNAKDAYDPASGTGRFEQIKPFTFYERLEFKNISHMHGGAVHAIFQGALQRWAMTMTDFETVVPLMDYGRITARFGFKKQGMHVSIKYLSPN